MNKRKRLNSGKSKTVKSTGGSASAKLRNYVRSKQAKALGETRVLANAYARIAPPVKSIYAVTAAYDIGNGGIYPNDPAYPARGTGASDRLGETIRMTSLTVQFCASVVASDVYNTIRVVAVQWASQNTTGNYPTGYSNLLFDSSAAVANLWFWPFNTVKKGAYKILKDQSFNLAISGRAQISGKWMFTPKDFLYDTITFIDNGGGSKPALEKGLIALYCFSDSQLAPHPQWNSIIRMNFTDS